MTEGEWSSRLTILRAHAGDPRAEFAQAVRAGLAAEPKRLPCRYFYDAAGAGLFEQICELPEYYLTAAETEILRDHSSVIVSRFPNVATVVELGSGNAAKTEILLAEFLRRGTELTFCPVDVCESVLRESGLRLVGRHRRLRVNAVVGEYAAAWGHVESSAGSPKLVLWMGSNIGNLDRTAAAAFLRRVAARLSPGDGLLIGIDLRKERSVLEAAYNDARGVTAAFNKNLLARINRELGGGFNLADFDHRARYLASEGRIEMHLLSRRRLLVPIGVLNTAVGFGEGEAVHTEDSYKYSAEEIAALLEQAGLRAMASDFDSRGRFVVVSVVPRQ